MKSATLAIALGLSAVLVGSQIFSGEKQTFLQCDLPEQAREGGLAPSFYVAYRDGGDKALITDGRGAESAKAAQWASMQDLGGRVVLSWEASQGETDSGTLAKMRYLAEISPVIHDFRLEAQSLDDARRIDVSGKCKPLVEHAALENLLAQG